MANIKISAASAVTTLGTTEEIPLALAGASKKITSANLRTQVMGNKVIPADYDQTVGSIVSATDSRFGLTSITGLKGTVYGRRIRLYPGSYTTLVIAKGGTAGTSFANCFLGLYNVSTLALINSVDITSAITAAGASTTTNYTFNNTIAAEGDFMLALLVGNSTTTICSMIGTAATITGGLPPIHVYRHNTGSLDALPNPFVNATTNLIAPWFQYS